MTVLVVDASVVLKWVIPEDPLAETEAARAIMRRARFVAPRLLDLECASVLWRKLRRGEITRDQADLMALALDSAPLGRVPEAGLWVRALSLAADRDHPPYDCAYVALAERVGADGVVTADRRFARAFSGWGPARASADRPFVVPVTEADVLLR